MIEEGENSGSETEEMEEIRVRTVDATPSFIEFHAFLEGLGQNNKLWEALRKKCLVTASECPALFQAGRSGQALASINKLYRFKKGLWEPPAPDETTQRILQHGKDTEAEALEFFLDRFNIAPIKEEVVASPGIAIMPMQTRAGEKVLLGASADALVRWPPEKLGRWRLVEIKCPWASMYSEVLPSHYCQVQFTMAVLRHSGRRDLKSAFLVVYKKDERDYPQLRVWKIRYSSLFWHYMVYEISLFHEALAVPGKEKHSHQRKHAEDMKGFLKTDMLIHVKQHDSRGWIAADHHYWPEVMDDIPVTVDLAMGGSTKRAVSSVMGKRK